MGTPRDRASDGLGRTLVVSGGWTVALTLFCWFGTRGANEIADSAYRDLDLIGWVLVVLAPVSLIAVWVQPRVVFLAVSVLTAVYMGRFYTGGPIYLVPIVAAAVIGWREPLRRSSALVLGVAVALPLVALVRPTGQSTLPQILGLLSWSLVPVVPWALAALARMNRTSAQHAADEQRRRVADEERMRVAREVHDVVGHSLAVISMQAGVALHVGERRPEQSRVALDAIARSSRDALAELRRTLAVFVGDPVADTPRASEQGIADIAPLVERFTSGGGRVELSLDVPPSLPTAVGFAVYRVVQESLTNAVRHGPGRVTRVGVTTVGARVHVDVVDDGPPVAADRGTGSGLVGMRERCESLGGTFRAGPRPEGGWVVHAELPCEHLSVGGDQR